MPNGSDELTKDLKAESVMETINPGSLMNMTDDENELWIESIREDLKSFEDLEVFDKVSPDEVMAMKDK
eukprot:12928057-Prorocentrum_lima.AAC.1